MACQNCCCKMPNDYHHRLRLPNELVWQLIVFVRVHQMHENNKLGPLMLVGGLFNVYLREHHQRSVEAYAKIKNMSVSCLIPGCQQTFKSAEQLAAHLLLHAQTYTCPVPGCLQTFESVQQLAAHLPSHAQTYTCPILGCLQTFESAQNLEAHINSHATLHFNENATTPPKITGEMSMVLICPKCKKYDVQCKCAPESSDSVTATVCSKCNKFYELCNCSSTSTSTSNNGEQVQCDEQDRAETDEAGPSEPKKQKKSH